jgi:hypothetical protein
MAGIGRDTAEDRQHLLPWPFQHLKIVAVMVKQQARDPVCAVPAPRLVEDRVDFRSIGHIRGGAEIDDAVQHELPLL